MERNVGIEERKINLLDMFWAVCLKWRQILLCAVVTALLAGGFSYFKSVQNAQQIANSAERVSLDELKLDDDSQDNVDVYLSYKQMCRDQMAYNDKSPLMKLNANGFYRNVIAYYVDNHFTVEYPLVDKKDTTGAIIASYKAGLKSEEFTAKLMDVTEKDADLISYEKELIDSANQFSQIDDSAYENGIMMISVYGADEQTCMELTEVVKAVIDSEKTTVTEKLGEHDIILIEDNCSYVADNDLLMYQQVNISKLAGYMTTIKDIKSRMTEDEIVYAEAYETEQVEEIAEDDERLTSKGATLPKITISKKMILAGFVVGGALAFLVVAILYLSNSRICLEDDFELTYGIKLLANIVVKNENKNRWFGFVDRFFIKMRHLNKHYFAEKEALSMAAAAIRIGAKKLEVSKVYITGATIGEEDKLVIEKLAGELKRNDIELIIGNPILYDAEALENSSEIGCVVLVEHAGVSLYKEVEKEIEICEHQDTKILGAIVVA